MHLKSLTLKGFKSFASATTLRFEPGITAIVGPNGSGKSNVVDAMAWVLGEQGAKALRGGKMDDVIFAGTAGRAPLGRAEVTLTIDNRDGALPIDYDEVSITRRMFRDGAGEYEMNGKACRLLDIQELLSDSGIGREMHVIVSQGHLDAVLSARPEDRRAFIEEAAGVLKHRKRKEKALRKLDAMQANLTRLTDLTGELRRQLGPLGRQAAVARRAAGVQADLRDARLRLLADDIARVTAQTQADEEAERAAQRQREELSAQLAAASAAGERAAAELEAATPDVGRWQRTHFDLSAQAERLRGTLSLAVERAHNLTMPIPVAEPGRDPDELIAEADRAEAEQADKDEAVRQARDRLGELAAVRDAHEKELADAEAELAAAARALADRREGLAVLAGKVGSARSRLAAGHDELERLAGAIEEARTRAADAEEQFEKLRDSVGDLDSSEVDLDARHEAAVAANARARDRVAELETAQREWTSQRRSLKARAEALALGLERGDAAGTVVAAGDRISGLIGPVSSVLTVARGAEAAITAALGPAADALAVTDLTAARAVIDLLKDRDGGRVGIVVGGEQGADHPDRPPASPGRGQRAADLVTAPPLLADAVTELLAGIVVVDDLAEATAVVEADPAVRAVTRDGDLVGTRWAVGGSRGRQSVIEIQAAVDAAERDLVEVESALAASDAALAGARDEARAREEELGRAIDALNESDAQISAVADTLARLGAAARAASAEVERLVERHRAAESALAETRKQATELQDRLAAAEAEDMPTEIDTERRDRLATVVAADRAAEVEAKLAVRTVEERARASAGTGERLRRAAASARAARARALELTRRRAVGADVAQRVAEAARAALGLIEDSVAAAAAARQAAESRRAQVGDEAEAARRALALLKAQWDALTDEVHQAEMAGAGRRAKLEHLAETAMAEFGLSPQELVAEYGPQVPVPPPAAEMAEYEAAKARGQAVSAPVPMPFDRQSTERRAARAQRDFAALGRINPLALEEYAAMEERHAFLATQLEDLKTTRADLLAVVEEVDAKILELFESAYRDVAAEFVTVFATLFPGGEGSLALTDPDDMLATGIEVMARPPGKKVKRLSLLSGGERSLIAVAMLVAIFRARPSPFYVLDEVEAALDEVNLTRLVGLLRELRASSQLLVITHQKYTMEAADVLYGVSMRGDGISQVISQRIADRVDVARPRT